MAALISSKASDMAYNILMMYSILTNGVPFLFTPINKSASELKEIILDVRLPKQKNRRNNVQDAIFILKRSLLCEKSFEAFLGNIRSYVQLMAVFLLILMENRIALGPPDLNCVLDISKIL
ncbi:UNVERIFIED_CONTAM: hypothetical protein NCL1_41048 [Trichonephila clavipes]